MVSLFVEDAIWDGGDFGRYEGVEEIREFFVGIKDQIVFAIHPVMNPIITVDGDTANAKWWLIMWCTMMVDGQKEARWFAAEYDDYLVKRDGKWLFTRIEVEGKFLAAHGRRLGRPDRVVRVLSPRPRPAGRAERSRVRFPTFMFLRESQGSGGTEWDNRDSAGKDVVSVPRARAPGPGTRRPARSACPRYARS